jgi:membrane-associated phospholipid phosphatase
MQIADSAQVRSPLRLLGAMAWLALLLVALAVFLQRSELDALLFAWAHAHARLPPLFWANVTLLGFGWVVVILVAAMDSGDGRATALLLRVLVLASLATHLPKLLLAHARPLAVLPLDAVILIGKPVRYSGSMPSGHALALGAALGLYWILRPGAWQPGRPVYWVMPATVAIAAWSRVAVGAHWPADVLMGLGLGLICALAAAWHESTRPWAPCMATPGGQRGIAFFELLAGVAWLCTSTGYPQAVVLQWAIGGLAVASGLWRLRRLLGQHAAPARVAGQGAPWA